MNKFHINFSLSFLSCPPPSCPPIIPTPHARTRYTCANQKPAGKGVCSLLLFGHHHRLSTPHELTNTPCFFLSSSPPLLLFSGFPLKTLLSVFASSQFSAWLVSFRHITWVSKQLVLSPAESTVCIRRWRHSSDRFSSQKFAVPKSTES